MAGRLSADRELSCLRLVAVQTVAKHLHASVDGGLGAFGLSREVYRELRLLTMLSTRNKGLTGSYDQCLTNAELACEYLWLLMENFELGQDQPRMMMFGCLVAEQQPAEGCWSKSW